MILSWFNFSSFVVTKLWCLIVYTYVSAQFLIVILSDSFASFLLKGYNIFYIFPVVLLIYLAISIYLNKSRTPKFWLKVKLFEGPLFFIFALLLIVKMIAEIVIYHEADLMPPTLAVLVLSFYGEFMLWRNK